MIGIFASNIKRWIVGHGWRVFALTFLMYWGIGLVLYADTMGNGFHYDDEFGIVKNEGIRHWENLWPIFKGAHFTGEFTWTGSHYRPMVYGSYLINYMAGGLRSKGYHLVNVHLHILMALMVALVIGGLAGHRGAGILSGLVFLVHPFNSEAVNYITARSSQLYALFYMMALYSYMQFRPPNPEKGGEGSRTYLAAAIVLFLLTLLSKEMAITFPLTLLLYEGIVRHPKTRQAWYRGMAIPSGFLVAGLMLYLWIRLYVVHDNVVGTLVRDMGTQLATQTKVLIMTIVLFLFPLNLSVEHPVEITHSFLDWPVVGACIILTGILAWAVRWGCSGQRERRLVAFFLIWFFIVLLPVVIFPLNAMLQENRAYLAVVGMVGILSLGIYRGVDWGRAHSMVLGRGLAMAVGVLILLSMGLTLERNGVWKDDVALWSDVVQKYPDSVVARTNLGVAYRRLGRYEGALNEFREVIQNDPNRFVAVYNMGLVLDKMGERSQAKYWFQQTLRLEPRFHKAHLALGLLYDDTGDFAKAISEYQITLGMAPFNAYARYRLANDLARIGRQREASGHYRILLGDKNSDPDLVEEVNRRLIQIQVGN